MSDDEQYPDNDLDVLEDAFREVLEKVRSGQVRMEIDPTMRMTAPVYEFLRELVGVKPMHLAEDCTVGEFVLDDVASEQAGEVLARYGIELTDAVLAMPLWQLYALANVDTRTRQ
jgi:hypothetical protein